MARQFSAIAAVFVGLALVYIILLVSFGSAGGPHASSSLVTAISALFGAALAFFLVRLFQIANALGWRA